MTPQIRDRMKLCPCIRSRCIELISKATDRGIAVTLIETIRAIDRQEYYVRIGASRTLKSLHLPQPPYGLALAFDLVPTAYLRERNWHPEGAFWAELGSMGEALGLEWGGRWRSFVDQPHHQLRRCLCA